MTESIKQWIADHAAKTFIYGVPPAYPAAFISGLTKGIEITEGFAEWAAKNHWFRSLHNGTTWVEMKDPGREIRQSRTFTTSQLLEKYLSHLETINKEKA